MDVDCPYCKLAQEINHDDGYGYKEEVLHTQDCICCDKTFIFTTQITYQYKVFKADCLNGSICHYKTTKTIPIEATKMRCVDCSKERNLTRKEWFNFLGRKVKT